MHQVRPEILRISSHDWPERDRVAMWREVIGRQVYRLDIEPVPEVSFHADSTMHLLPGLSMFSTTGGGFSESRTRELISDGNSDFVFVINLKGQLKVSKRDREFILDEQEATLLSAAEVCGFTRPPSGHTRILRMPRARIASLLPRVDDAVTGYIPPGSRILAHLTRYLGLLEEDHTLIDSQTAPLIVAHVYSLVAATIGATRDNLERARSCGVPEARLAAIRADILANLSQVGLSPRSVARRHGVSDRYVHRLFEKTGQTFGRFVEEQRLKRAFAMLTDPASIEVGIGTIGLGVGFSEHSTFHRAFRRYFGDTPGNVRRDRLRT
jgi:AraC-like DNA-binding protein